MKASLESVGAMTLFVHDWEIAEKLSEAEGS